MCSQVGKTDFAGGMCFPGWGTHITRDKLHYPGTGISSDMCSPTRETHIPSKMCFPYPGTHIPSDMYSPPRPRKEHKSQVIRVPQPVKHIPEGSLRSKRFRLVSEQRNTEEGDFRYWPREKWNAPLFSRSLTSLTLVPRSCRLNRTETLATQANLKEIPCINKVTIHSTSYTCYPTWETHITNDMCSLPRKPISLVTCDI